MPHRVQASLLALDPTRTSAAAAVARPAHPAWRAPAGLPARRPGRARLPPGRTLPRDRPRPRGV